MQYRIKTLQFIKLFTLVFSLVVVQNISAQKTKIDGLAVVIGKNIVLDSDIEKFKQEVEQNNEGKITISDCEMLEQLMLQKLLAHHAIVDSVTVSDAEINAGVDRNIRYFIQQYGSEEKMVNAYNFNDVDDLKKELYNIEKEKMLIGREQAKITETIDVTPEEVRIYYNGLKKENNLPEFPAEISMAQIVVYANPEANESERIIKKLNQIKKDIEGGSSIKMKAIINSEDPGVTQNGGRYPVTKESGLDATFKDMAFSLEVNEVSEPFKTQFGYHIMQLHTVKGNIREVSHILLQPQIPEDKLKETEAKVEKIKQEIKDGEITFEEAVKKYSEDKATKFNGGVIINQSTGETTFDLTRMDPALYARVNNLQKTEISDVFYDETREGEKMYKFLYMKDRTNTHTADLVDDYVKIQQLALQKKKQETIRKWSNEKINDTYIKLNNNHKKCTFERNWKKEIN
ncbi:periplasmic chaperone for outer membrane proteins SurA [Lutibacter sp. Hel_I_33_5]|uniref:peptidylprolyl isomerase n=1 Tax=Lutibacter sp. Hel_I_33_5 TaxID=1566289 RepID=UPI0011A7DB78|nr:peptidylprolyl isomerase [Lutibacter sp. Hel_I_33_5]TVZ57242.1 periplasmic chaperone for outer membrane proteins SurA [Lutibacter sp. Hel_I_33_5]